MSFDIKTKANSYLSVLATSPFKVGSSVILIGKLGFSKYLQKADATIIYSSRSFKDIRSAAVLSVGEVINTKAQHGFERSLPNIFGDAGALYTTGVYCYRFEYLHVRQLEQAGNTDVASLRNPELLDWISNQLNCLIITSES